MYGGLQLRRYAGLLIYFAAEMLRLNIQPNEYGLTNPESKSSNQCTAIPVGTPDSRIGSKKNQKGGRIAAARIVDWVPIQKSSRG